MAEKYGQCAPRRNKISHLHCPITHCSLRMLAAANLSSRQNASELTATSINSCNAADAISGFWFLWWAHVAWFSLAFYPQEMLHLKDKYKIELYIRWGSLRGLKCPRSRIPLSQSLSSSVYLTSPAIHVKQIGGSNRLTKKETNK